MSNFVNLHQHSIYSVRDAVAKIPDLVSRAKELGHPGLAITDHGTMGGALKFYLECQKQEIKPILGVEAYIAPGSRFDKDKSTKYYHLTLIAMNNTGWNNLSFLVSESFKEENFYYKPRIDRELLARYSEGLIVLSGCIGGHLSHAIMDDLGISFEDEEGHTSGHTHEHEEVEYTGNETYKDIARWYKKIFGDRFYLEIQNHNFGPERTVNEVIMSLSKELDIKVVATGDTHFVLEEDSYTHAIMLAIRDGITVHDEKMSKIKYPGDGYHLLSEQEILDRFPGNPEVVYNTMEIYERCNVVFDLGNFKIPHVVDPKDENKYFTGLVVKGLIQKYGHPLPKAVVERAQMEINTIVQMTFPSYFLIVMDYVNYCKSVDIPVGTSRGSAAGSIVSYALGITSIDPLKHDLSFARFLNSSRSSTPKVNFPELTFEQWREENGRKAA